MAASPPFAQSDDSVGAARRCAPRCVLVDDDPYFLKLTEILVLKARPGIEVIPFTEAVSALDFLSHQRADLVITDVRMPVMDGLQLTAAVRAIYADVPIVVISSQELAPEALAQGANAFIAKSAIHTQLGSVLKRLFAPAH